MNLIAYDGQIELEDDDWLDVEINGGDENEWGCCFPDRCLMPSYDHLRSECYDVEMYEAWYKEQTKNGGQY